MSWMSVSCAILVSLRAVCDVRHRGSRPAGCQGWTETRSPKDPLRFVIRSGLCVAVANVREGMHELRMTSDKPFKKCARVVVDHVKVDDGSSADRCWH